MAETILPLKINAKLSNEQLELFVDKLNEFDKETGLDTTLISMSAIAKRVEARTSNEENTALPLHGVVFSEERAEVCACGRNMEKTKPNEWRCICGRGVWITQT